MVDYASQIRLRQMDRFAKKRFKTDRKEPEIKPTLIKVEVNESMWNSACRLFLTKNKNSIGKNVELFGVKFTIKAGDTPEKIKERIRSYNMDLKFKTDRRK